MNCCVQSRSTTSARRSTIEATDSWAMYVRLERPTQLRLKKSCFVSASLCISIRKSSHHSSGFPAPFQSSNKMLMALLQVGKTMGCYWSWSFKQISRLVRRRSVNLVPLSRCIKAPKCPKRCLPIMDPVCGSDGQRYLNHCRMQELNCGWVNSSPSFRTLSSREHNINPREEIYLLNSHSPNPCAYKLTWLMSEESSAKPHCVVAISVNIPLLPKLNLTCPICKKKLFVIYW